jgi:hypothetical protein
LGFFCYPARSFCCVDIEGTEFCVTGLSRGVYFLLARRLLISWFFVVYNSVASLLRTDDVIEIADPRFCYVSLQAGPKQQIAEFMSVRVNSPLSLTVNGKRLGLFVTMLVSIGLANPSCIHQTPTKSLMQQSRLRSRPDKEKKYHRVIEKEEKFTRPWLHP